MSPLLTTRCLALAGVLALPAFAPAQEYKTFREAHDAGLKAIRAGNLNAAQVPLEIAVGLAKTDAERLEVNRTLLTPYRELPTIEPMQRAAEYVITHSKQNAEQSLTRRTLLAFVHKRGKLDAAVEGYEAQLKKDKDDRTVIFILLEAYSGLKPDPNRVVELATRLIALDKKAGKQPDVHQHSQIAAQFVKAGKVKEGAAMFEETAALDDAYAARNLKDAAAAWLKAGDKEKALAAARKSAAAKPEKGGGGLEYFWHRGLGDVFLDAGDPKAAVGHFEKALTLTKIDGYLKDTRTKLEQAKTAAGP